MSGPGIQLLIEKGFELKTIEASGNQKIRINVLTL